MKKVFNWIFYAYKKRRFQKLGPRDEQLSDIIKHINETKNLHRPG